ncbi:MAG: hypothetical protein PHD82_08710 [Candidatus Riflebacteria bacterium]|nr:hypothetical protein [Candidatus Riflebacteria bacterium]
MGLPFFRELFEALWESKHEDITDNLDYMRGEYNPTHSRPPEEKQLICKAFTEAFRLVLMPHQLNFTHYPRVLEMFLRYARFYADQEPWNAEVRNLFIYPDIFTPSYYDAEIQSPMTLDFIFLEHVQQMEGFMGTALFGRWARLPDNLNFLSQYLKRTLELLLYASLNCCDVLFAAQVRWNAALLAAIPELAGEFEPVIRVVSRCQNRAFIFMPEGRIRLKAELERIIKLSRSAESSALLNKLQSALDEVNASVMPVSRQSLSVEAIYHAALKDIMADEILSPEEKEMIRNLREFVPIAPDSYQRIFDKTLAEKQAAPAAAAGEFAADVFMRKLIDDFCHSLDEQSTEMLLATGDALLLSRKTVKSWLENARQQPPSSQNSAPKITWPGISPASQSALDKLGECEALAAELRASSVFARIEARAAELDKIMRKSAAETAPENVDLLLARNSFTAFLSDPGVVRVPTIIYFIFSPQIHHARLQFKGETMQAHLQVEIEKLLAAKIPFIQGDILSLYNGDLNRSIESQFYCKDGLETFVDGLRQSKGVYRIALVNFPSLTPVKIFNQQGYIDMSGLFGQINSLFGQKKYAETIQACEALIKEQPALGQVSYMLARIYKTLAVDEIEPEKNFELAEIHYNEELKKMPGSIDAMLGLGIICKRRGDFASAEQWFEKALKVSPFCLSLIVTWVTTRMSRLTDEKCSTEEIVADVCRHLGPCYLIDPDNPILKDVVDYISSIFRKFLPGHITLTEIDYRNM